MQERRDALKEECKTGGDAVNGRMQNKYSKKHGVGCRTGGIQERRYEGK